MSRKADRHEPVKVIGRSTGEPESSALHDSSLDAGTSVNGAPPLLGLGDAQLKLVQVRCHCGHVVAELWRSERSERSDRAPFWSVLAQVIEDAGARPVVMRHIRNVVRPGAILVTDCPAHGRHEVAANALLNAGRRALDRYQAGKLTQVEKFVLPHVSRP